jgi:hypothetical protein
MSHSIGERWTGASQALLTRASESSAPLTASRPSYINLRGLEKPAPERTPMECRSPTRPAPLTLALSGT